MDPILFWNEVALEANRVDHTVDSDKREQGGPTRSSRAIAIIHLAMYDAYAAARGNPVAPVDLTPFWPGIAAPLGLPADPAAAAAGAAHACLVALYPSQKEFFDRRLAAAPLGAVDVAAGLALGQVAAQRLLDDRRGDILSAPGYQPSPLPGRHRPDPDNPGQGFDGPLYGQNRVFAVPGRPGLNPPPGMVPAPGAGFRLDPAAPTYPAYLVALRQVRAQGVLPDLAGTLPGGLGFSYREPDQTMMGIYWAYDGAAGLGTPPRLYNQLVRAVATAQGNDPDKNARLFALVNAAMGDAGVLAWEQKYLYDLWRPIVGIREHDLSMGPAGVGNNPVSTDCDPLWLPLGAPSTNSKGKPVSFTTTTYPAVSAVTSLVKNFTPPFPAYPSGHATFGAAALHITRRFYGVAPGDTSPDALFNGLTFVSDELNGVNMDNQGAVRPRHVRSFPNGLWQMIVENGLSRVYLGVHWFFDAFLLDAGNLPDVPASITANIGGVPLGLAIADGIFDNGLQRQP